jgi:ferredoxin
VWLKFKKLFLECDIMKVVHEVEKCIGCGTCVALCPALFEMEGAKAKLKGGKMEGGNRVLEREFTPEEQECAKQSADNCPVSCIHVE